MGNVYLVEKDMRLYENEHQLNIDVDDRNLMSIDMLIYHPNTTFKSFSVWDKSLGDFNWNAIFQCMKKVRKEVGFSRVDIFKHNVDIVPLKILCAKMYRDHYGLELCHDVKNVMDFETQTSVFRKQVWWV